MAIKTIIDHLWPKLQKQSEFARDAERICDLISDCISLNHPVVMEIRYRFCLYVSGNCWGSREKWERVIRGYDYSLPKFVETIRGNVAFRKKVINWLESEKLKLIEGAELLKADKNGDNTRI